MKRKKRMLLLLACLVLLAGAAVAVSLLGPSGEPAAPAVQKDAVLSIDPESITALSWSAAEELAFRKENGSWVYSQDPRFPVNEEKFGKALKEIGAIASTRTLENIENPADFGLEEPLCTVQVTAGGEQYTLKLGIQSGMGGARYLSIGDGNVYMVQNSLFSTFNCTLYDLVQQEEIPAMANFTEMTLKQPDGGYKIEKDPDSGRAYADSYVWFLGDTTLDNEQTEEFLAKAAGIKWKSCVSYYAEDLARYGLEEPAAVVHFAYEHVETADDGTETRSPAEFTLHLGSESEKGRYACLPGSRMVYEIDAKQASLLLDTDVGTMMPDEVFTLVWDPVYQMDIHYGGKVYELIEDTHIVDGKEKLDYFLDGERVAAKSIFYVINTLASDGYATGEIPGKDEIIRFVIYREHETFPKLELAFYAYDETRYLTELNGEITVFATRESVDTLVTDLKANVLMKEAA